MNINTETSESRFKEFKDFLYANLDPLTQCAIIRIKVRDVAQFCQIMLSTHDISHFTCIEDFIYCMDTTAQYHGLAEDKFQTIMYVVKADGYLECLGLDDGYAAHWNAAQDFHREKGQAKGVINNDSLSTSD